MYIYVLFFIIGRIAVAGLDYEGQSYVLLTFNATTRTIQVPVGLIDDNDFEGDEDFNGLLSLVSSLSRVTIAPANAIATIVEDESMSACVCHI